MARTIPTLSPTAQAMLLHIAVAARYNGTTRLRLEPLIVPLYNRRWSHDGYGEAISFVMPHKASYGGKRSVRANRNTTGILVRHGLLTLTEQGAEGPSGPYTEVLGTITDKGWSVVKHYGPLYQKQRAEYEEKLQAAVGRPTWMVDVTLRRTVTQQQYWSKDYTIEAETAEEAAKIGKEMITARGGAPYWREAMGTTEEHKGSRYVMKPQVLPAPDKLRVFEHENKHGVNLPHIEGLDELIAGLAT